MKILRIAARAFLGLALIWLLLMAVKLWSRIERPPNESLRLLYSALHDYLNTHGKVWPKDPNHTFRDLIQSQPDFVNSDGVVFTLFDDEPNTAFRYPTQPWAFVTPQSSWITYKLMPDGSIEKQSPELSLTIPLPNTIQPFFAFVDTHAIYWLMILALGFEIRYLSQRDRREQITMIGWGSATRREHPSFFFMLWALHIAASLFFAFRITGYLASWY